MPKYKPFFIFALAAIAGVSIGGISIFAFRNDPPYVSLPSKATQPGKIESKPNAPPASVNTNTESLPSSTAAQPEIESPANNTFLSNIEISLPTGMSLEQVNYLHLGLNKLDLSNNKVSFDHFDDSGNYPRGELIITCKLDVRVSITFVPDEVRGDYYNLTIVPPLKFPRKSLINEYLLYFRISPELAKKILDNNSKVIINRIRITVWDNDTNGTDIYDEDVALPIPAKPQKNSAHQKNPVQTSE